MSKYQVAPDEEGNADSPAGVNGPPIPASDGPPIPSAEVEEEEPAEITLEAIEKLLAEKNKKGCLIMPTTKFMKNWDILMITLLMFTAVVTPFEVGFLQVHWTEPLFWVNRLVDFGFICDMCINFFLAYFSDEEGKYITDLNRIQRKYMCSWFPIDLVSVLPFDVLSFTMPAGGENMKQLKILRIVRLLRLIKLLRILKSAKVLKRIQNMMGLTFTTVAMIKFLASIVSCLHWSACAWNIMAGLEDIPEEEKWYGEDWADLEPGHMYAMCFEFSMMGMVMGYGQVEPANYTEEVVAIVIMIISGAIYAYVIGAICGIVSQMDPATQHYNQTMDQLNGFMEEIHLPQEQRNDYRDYFTFCKHKFKVEYYLNLLEQMSPTLRGNISMHLHADSICNVPFFNCNDDKERESFISMLATELKPEAFAPGELLITPNEVAETMYIIEKGLVGCQGRVKRAKDVIGEDMIMSERNRPYSAHVMTYIDTYSLQKEVLNDILGTGKFPRTQTLIRWACIKMAFKQEMAELTALERMQPGYKPMSKADIEAWKAKMKAIGEDKSESAAAARDDEQPAEEEEEAPPMDAMEAYKLKKQQSLPASSGGGDGGGGLGEDDAFQAVDMRLATIEKQMTKLMSIVQERL